MLLVEEVRLLDRVSEVFFIIHIKEIFSLRQKNPKHFWKTFRIFTSVRPSPSKPTKQVCILTAVLSFCRRMINCNLIATKEHPKSLHSSSVFAMHRHFYTGKRK